jgi:hypothetical protein
MIGATFRKIYICCFALAASSSALLPSWLNYKTSEALSFGVNDGWCNPSTQGIGKHCFGDFYYPLFLSQQSNPWSDTPNPYPPLALYLYKPFSLIEDYFGSRCALFSYLAMILVAILIPLIHASIKLKLSESNILILSLVTLGSAPILIVFDRGNSAILLLPLLYFVTLQLKNENWSRAMNLILLCSLIRPQFVLLFLIFILSGKLRKSLEALILTSLGLVISFIIYPHNVIRNLNDWVLQVISYQDYGTQGSMYPVNISMTNTINLGTRALNISINHNTVKLIVYGTLIVFFSLYWVKRNSMPLRSKWISVLLTPIFFISTTFHYYLFVVSLLFVIDQIWPEDEPNIKGKSGKVVKLIDTTKKLLYIATLIPWGIPWLLFPEMTVERGWTVIGIQWTLVQIILFTYVILIYCLQPFCNESRAERQKK